jgi:hypothetical protein
VSECFYLEREVDSPRIGRTNEPKSGIIQLNSGARGHMQSESHIPQIEGV